MKKIFVLDTNVLLYNARALESFEDNEVVIPMTVVEEIDKFKRNQDELGRNARHTIRMLDELRKKGKLSDGVKLTNSPDPEKCGTVRIMISHGRLSESSDMSVPDNRILNVAKMLRDSNDCPVRFITKDINLRLKADALDIDVEDYDTENLEYDELYSGVTEFGVETDYITQLHQEHIMPVPAGLEICPNQFCIFHDTANPGHTYPR